MLFYFSDIIILLVSGLLEIVYIRNCMYLYIYTYTLCVCVCVCVCMCVCVCVCIYIYIYITYLLILRYIVIALNKEHLVIPTTLGTEMLFFVGGRSEFGRTIRYNTKFL